MSKLIELKTVLAGPQGVLQPGRYTAEQLRDVGYGAVADLVDEVEKGGGGDDWRPPPVTAVSGIGPKTAAALEKLKITNVSELVEVDPAMVAEKLGVSEEKAEEWRTAAFELMYEVEE